MKDRGINEKYFWDWPCCISIMKEKTGNERQTFHDQLFIICPSSTMNKEQF